MKTNRPAAVDKKLISLANSTGAANPKIATERGRQEILRDASTCWQYLRSLNPVFNPAAGVVCGRNSCKSIMVPVEYRRESYDPNPMNTRFFKYLCDNGIMHTAKHGTYLKHFIFSERNNPIMTIMNTIFSLATTDSVDHILNGNNIHANDIIRVTNVLTSIFSMDLFFQNAVQLGGADVDHVQVSVSGCPGNTAEANWWILLIVEAIEVKDGTTPGPDRQSVYAAGKRYICTYHCEDAEAFVNTIKQYVVPGTTVRSSIVEMRKNGPKCMQHRFVSSSKVEYLKPYHLKRRFGEADDGRNVTNLCHIVWEEINTYSRNLKNRDGYSGKIMRYLWRWYNRNEIWVALERCFQIAGILHTENYNCMQDDIMTVNNEKRDKKAKRPLRRNKRTRGRGANAKSYISNGSGTDSEIDKGMADSDERPLKNMRNNNPNGLIKREESMYYRDVPIKCEDTSMEHPQHQQTSPSRNAPSEFTALNTEEPPRLTHVPYPIQISVIEALVNIMNFRRFEDFIIAASDLYALHQLRNADNDSIPLPRSAVEDAYRRLEKSQSNGGHFNL